MRLQHLFRISLMSWACILSACSTQLLSSEKNNVVINSAVAQSLATQAGPFISVDQEHMYKIMVAEIANANEDPAQAVPYLYEVAQARQDATLAKRATETALLAEDFPFIEKTAQLWLQLSPDNVDAHQALVIAALKQEQPERALQHLNAMTAHLNQLDEGRLQQMLLLLQQAKDDAQGLDIMQKLLAKQPKNPNLLMLSSQLLTKLKRYPQAIEELEKLLALTPDQPEVVDLYVKLLIHEKKLAKASAKLSKLLAIYPQQNEWRLLYSHILIIEKKYNAAKAQLKKILNQDPDNQEARFTLASLLLENENYAASKPYLLDFIQHAKNHNQRQAGYFFIAQAADQSEQWDEALLWYQKIHTDYTDYLKSQARIVSIYMEEQRWDEALAYLEKVQTQDKSEALEILSWKAAILIKAQREQEALTVYDQNLLAEPDNPDVLYLRALLADELNHMDLMERDLKHLLNLNPEHVDALNALGYSLSTKTERYDEAHELIKKALALKPEAYYIMDSMGWVLFKMNKLDGAKNYLQQALKSKQDPEIASHLGEVLWALGDKQAARHVWQTALKNAPEDARLLDVMQRLDKTAQ